MTDQEKEMIEIASEAGFDQTIDHSEAHLPTDLERMYDNYTRHFTDVTYKIEITMAEGGTPIIWGPGFNFKSAASAIHRFLSMEDGGARYLKSECFRYHDDDKQDKIWSITWRKEEYR